MMERKGFWMPYGKGALVRGWKCSNCLQVAYYPKAKKGESERCRYIFCPYCGARM